MADGKVFTDSTKDGLVKIVDDAIKLGVVGELLDNLAIRGAVNVIDFYGDKIIPDDYDPFINEVIQLILEEKYALAAEKAGSLMNKLIDLPVMDETTEEFVFVQGMKFLVSMLMNYIEKQKSS